MVSSPALNQIFMLAKVEERPKGPPTSLEVFWYCAILIFFNRNPSFFRKTEFCGHEGPSALRIFQQHAAFRKLQKNDKFSQKPVSRVLRMTSDF